MTPLLDVQNISKAFGAHVLFENISFSIAEGQHVGLIAKNGTGKSTLLSLLSGKESVDSGSIIFRRDMAFSNNSLSSTQRSQCSTLALTIRATPTTY